MAAPKMKPTNLKIVLIVILLTTIVGSVAGFYFAKTQLTEFAQQVSNSSPDTNPDLKTEAMVAELNSYISTNQTTATESSAKVIASTTDYQKQVTAAIDAAEVTSGLNVTRSSFGKPTDQTELPPISDLTANYVTLTFTGSISYDNFVKFLQAIENSTPKLQVLGINITPDTKNTSKISVTPLIIGFYTR